MHEALLWAKRLITVWGSWWDAVHILSQCSLQENKDNPNEKNRGYLLRTLWQWCQPLSLSFGDILNQLSYWKALMFEGWDGEAGGRLIRNMASYMIDFVSFRLYKYLYIQLIHRGHPYISSPDLHIRRSISSQILRTNKYRHATLSSFFHRKIEQPDTLLKLLSIGRICFYQFLPEWGCNVIIFSHIGGTEVYDKSFTYQSCWLSFSGSKNSNEVKGWKRKQ